MCTAMQQLLFARFWPNLVTSMAGLKKCDIVETGNPVVDAITTSNT